MAGAASYSPQAVDLRVQVSSVSTKTLAAPHFQMQDRMTHTVLEYQSQKDLRNLPGQRSHFLIKRPRLREAKERC